MFTTGGLVKKLCAGRGMEEGEGGGGRGRGKVEDMSSRFS